MHAFCFGRLILSVAGLIGASHALAGDDIAMPALASNVVSFIDNKYMSAENSKAVAITLDGQHAHYVSKRNDNSLAAGGALYNCMRNTKHACRLFAVGDYPIYKDYVKAANLSDKIIADLSPNLRSPAYGDETKNSDVDAIEGLRDGSVIATPTPLQGPDGVSGITTPDLVKLYKANPDLVVIDALGGVGGMSATLPKALWISGIGDGADKLVNLTIDENLAFVLPDLIPSKDVPIVTYCADWRCWHSWNAARRLVASGYTNVMWYRGGLAAWKAAGLPLIAEMPAAAMVH